MAGLLLAIHAFNLAAAAKAWVAGTRQHEAGHDRGVAGTDGESVMQAVGY
jgi:hypothetical protein